MPGIVVGFKATDVHYPYHALGASLWLVPPSYSPIYFHLSYLVARDIPSKFPGLSTPFFIPHVTLTSGVPTDLGDAEAFLDKLSIPATNEVAITFEALDIGEELVKKCTLRVTKSWGLEALAKECRRMGVEQGDEEKAEKWVKEEYGPHCSLMYADIDVSEKQKKSLENAVTKRGLNFHREGELAGWKGGEVWLVDTSKGFESWAPVAVRKL